MASLRNDESDDILHRKVHIRRAYDLEFFEMRNIRLDNPNPVCTTQFLCDVRIGTEGEHDVRLIPSLYHRTCRSSGRHIQHYELRISGLDVETPMVCALGRGSLWRVDGMCNRENSADWCVKDFGFGWGGDEDDRVEGRCLNPRSGCEGHAGGESVMVKGEVRENGGGDVSSSMVTWTGA